MEGMRSSLDFKIEARLLTIIKHFLDLNPSSIFKMDTFETCCFPNCSLEISDCINKYTSV